MCEICRNRPCSKAEILLRRTDTFGPVCFIYAFLSPISKAETLKGTLLQTDNFFHSSDKKHELHQHELNWIFLSNLSKRNIFLHFKNNNYFFDFILIIKCDTFEWNSVSFFLSCSLQPAVVLFHWKWYRTGTFKPYITPLWTIGFSIVIYIKLWWSFKDLHKNALKSSTVDILTSEKNVVLFMHLFILFSQL